MELSKLVDEKKYPARNIVLKGLSFTAEKTGAMKAAILRVANLYDKTAIDELLKPLQIGQLSNRKTYETWTALAAAPGTLATDSAEVVFPTGSRTTHVDPVTAATVFDDGLYLWNTGTPGWKRVSDGFASLVTQAQFTAVYGDSDAWISAFEIKDDAGNLLITIDTQFINHPDTNAMRAALTDAPTWTEYDGWVDGLIIEDEAGNRLFELDDTLIIHPWAIATDATLVDHETRIGTLEDEVAALDPGNITDLQTRMTAAENTIKRLVRSNSLIALFGDSRLDQWDATTGRISSWCYINWLNGFLGHPWDVGNDHAVSGQRSDQYLTTANVDDGIASNCLLFFIFGFENDFAQNGIGSYFTNIVKPQVLRILANGGIPVLHTDPCDQTMTGSSLRDSIDANNQAIRQFCSDYPRCILVDLAGSTTDPTSRYMMKTGYAYSNGGDQNTHFTTKAASRQALDALATFKRRPEVCPIIERMVANNVINTIQLGDNALLLNGGGVAGAGMAGPVAGNANISCTGLVTGVASLVSNPTGFGQRQKMVLTATGVGECVMAMDMTTLENVGEQFRAHAVVDSDPGNSGLESPLLRLVSQRNGVSAWTSDLENDTLHGSCEDLLGNTLTLRTPTLTIAAGTRNFFTRQIRFPFAGAGSATVYVSRMGVHKQITY